MEPCAPATPLKTSLIWSVRLPMMLLDFFFLIFFLCAVWHAVSDMSDFRQLLLLLVTPAVCYYCSRSPNTRTSTKLATALFLAMMNVGDILAFTVPVYSRNPPKGMSPHDAAALRCYLQAYLLFLFVVLPPLLFLRALVDRYRKRRPQFSIVTSVLGLLLWIVMGPLAIWLVVDFYQNGPYPRN